MTIYIIYPLLHRFGHPKNMRMRMFSSFENMSSAGQKTAVLGTRCFPSCQRWNQIVRYSFLKNRNPHARMSSVTHTPFILGLVLQNPIFWKKKKTIRRDCEETPEFGVFVHLSVPRHWFTETCFSPINWSSMMLIKWMTPWVCCRLENKHQSDRITWMSFRILREKITKQQTKHTSRRPGRFDWNEWVISPGNHKQWSYPNRDQH